LILSDGFLVGLKFLLALLERIFESGDGLRVVALVEGGEARFIGISRFRAPGANGCVDVLGGEAVLLGYC